MLRGDYFDDGARAAFAPPFPPSRGRDPVARLVVSNRASDNDMVTRRALDGHPSTSGKHVANMSQRGMSRWFLPSGEWAMRSCSVMGVEAGWRKGAFV